GSGALYHAQRVVLAAGLHGRQQLHLSLGERGEDRRARELAERDQLAVDPAPRLPLRRSVYTRRQCESSTAWWGRAWATRCVRAWCWSTSSVRATRWRSWPPAAPPTSSRNASKA